MTVKTVHLVSRDSHPACLDFLEAFFHWASADVNSDPGNLLVAGVSDPTKLHSEAVLQRMPLIERAALQHTLVKHRFGEEPQREHLRLSGKEERLWNEYKALFLKLPRVTDALDREELSATSVPRPDRAILAKLLKKLLRPSAGSVEAMPRSNRVWSHQTQIDGWAIGTEIDIGGASDRIVQYEHGIRSARDNRPLAQCVSVLKWRGLSMQSQWSYAMGRDEDAIATDVVNMVRYWLEAVPSLIVGLKP